MKARNLVTIILKLMGLYVFMQFFLMLPSSLRGLLATRSASFNAMDGLTSGFESVFVFLFWLSFIYLAFYVSLFFAAQKLSRFFVERQEEEVTLSGGVSDGMQTWPFRCFGVYALITWGPRHRSC